MRPAGGACVVSAVLLVFTLGFTPGLSASAGEPIGRVDRLEGDVLVTHADATVPEPLHLDAPVRLHDQIQTLTDSKVAIRFEDDTVVSLGAESTLRVTEFVYSPGREHRSAVLELIGGVFRAIVGKLLPDSAFELRTQEVVAAVRGTDCMGEVSEDTTSVVVLEGAVAVRPRAGEGPREVVLREGEGVDVRMGEPFTKKRWGQGRIDAMRERMFRRMSSGRMGREPSKRRGMRSEPMGSDMGSRRARSP